MIELLTKVLVSLVHIPFVAMVTLWPINDKSTSKGQFLAFTIIESLILFGVWG